MLYRLRRLGVGISLMVAALALVHLLKPPQPPSSLVNLAVFGSDANARPMSSFRAATPAALTPAPTQLVTHPVETSRPSTLPAYLELLDSYRAMHRRMLAEELPPRFLLYRPNAQLGNRLRGIISAFVYCLLTDRALVVEFSSAPYEKIRLSDLFASPGFEWELSAGSEWVRGLEAEPLLREGTFLPQPTLEALLCRGREAIVAPLALVDGNLYWSTFLEHNPHFADFFARHFEAGRVGERVAQTLFEPHPAVEALRRRWREQEGVEGKHLVALQVRNDNDPRRHPQVSEAEWRAYVDCSVQNLPAGVLKSEAVWFVATDSVASREIAAERLQGLNFRFNTQSFLPGGSVEGLRQALADILIAAEASQAYLSPWSSYGRMIALLNRNGGDFFMVTDGVNPPKDVHRSFNSTGTPHCFRLLSREECPWLDAHTWFSKEVKRASCYRPSMQLPYC